MDRGKERNRGKKPRYMFNVEHRLEKEKTNRK